MTLTLALKPISVLEVSVLEPTLLLAHSMLVAMPLESVTPLLDSARLLAVFALELFVTTHHLATLEVFVTF